MLSDGIYTTLEVPGSILNNANGINSFGEIVGSYNDNNGFRHGYLATPQNSAPTLVITGPTSTVPGQPQSYTFTTTDNSNGTFVYNINWGDGNTDAVSAGKALTLSHVYTAPGNCTIQATVTDPDNHTSSTATHAVVVTSAALQTDPWDATKTALVVGGSTGNDVIVLSPGSSAGSIAVALNGTSLGTFITSA